MTNTMNEETERAPEQGGGQESREEEQQGAGQGKALRASRKHQEDDERQQRSDEVASAFHPATDQPLRSKIFPDHRFQGLDQVPVKYREHVQSAFDKIGVTATPEIVAQLRRLDTSIKDVRHAVAIAHDKGIHDERYVYKILSKRRHQRTPRTDFTRPAYANTRWLDDENQCLRDEVQRRWPLDEIARLHRRTRSAIQNRVLRLYGDGSPEVRKYGLPTQPAPKHEARRCSVFTCNDFVQDGTPMCIPHFTDSRAKSPPPNIEPAPTLAQIRARLTGSD